MGKERENSYRKLKRSLEERYTQTHRKLIGNILMITDVFLNQKRVNVCEYTVKTQKMGKIKGKLLQKNEEITGGMAHRSLFEIFWQSQMSFLIRREQMHMNTWYRWHLFFSHFFVICTLVLSFPHGVISRWRTNTKEHWENNEMFWQLHTSLSIQRG